MGLYLAVLHRLDAMNVEWTLYSFQLPYLSGNLRHGLVLRFLTEEGQQKWGEIAPFPGRSKETLTDASAQILQLLKTGTVEGPLFPSVQFGLESAFAPPVQMTASLYALLTGDPQTVLKQADRAEQEGYTTVKLKVATFSPTICQQIINQLKDRFRIRIDCNSAFSFEEALSLFSPFDPAIFDYIEDPTFELNRLAEFPYPFALDETVSQYRSLPLHSYSNLYGFILKPTILGGKKGCASYIECAQNNKLKIVLSSAFESDLGLLQILSLAKTLGHLDPLGLDTFRYLGKSLLNPPIDFNAPLVTITEIPGINLHHLTEIDHGTCALPIF
jgi:O-succinylbenzoate synthase